MLDIVMFLVAQQHMSLYANSSSIFFTPLIYPHNWAELPRQKPLVEEKALANWKVQKSVNQSFESSLQLWSDLMIGVFCAWEPNKLYGRSHTHKLCCVHHHFMVSEVFWSSLYLHAFTCTYRAVMWCACLYHDSLCICSFSRSLHMHQLTDSQCGNCRVNSLPDCAHMPGLSMGWTPSQKVRSSKCVCAHSWRQSDSLGIIATFTFTSCDAAQLRWSRTSLCCPVFVVERLVENNTALGEECCQIAQ